MNGVIPSIVPILVSKSVLNAVDKDNINSELTNKGDYQANLMLIDRMKSRATPRKWYCVFLQALINVGYKHLVETVEPKFISNHDAFLEKFGVDGLDYSVTRLEDMSIHETVLHVHEEGEVDTNDLGAPPIPPRTYSLDTSISNQSETEQFDSNTNLKQLNIKPDMVKNIEFGDDGPENKDESSDDNSMASDCEETQQDPSNDVNTKYELRSYQIELAQDAIIGRNTIICSETGTGKTWVALEIIKKHFEAATNGKNDLKN